MFEAYLPAAKRRYGYFALPVLVDDRIVAAIDLKADRAADGMTIQKWSWVAEVGSQQGQAIDSELARFEHFQLDRPVLDMEMPAEAGIPKGGEGAS